MFLNKSFSSLTSALKSTYGGSNSKISTAFQTEESYLLSINKKQQQIDIYQLQQKLKSFYQQNSELKDQLDKLKQIFITAKIQNDNEIRAYDELLEQLREDLAEKQQLIQRYELNIQTQLQGQLVKKEKKAQQNNYKLKQVQQQKQNTEQNKYQNEAQAHLKNPHKKSSKQQNINLSDIILTDQILTPLPNNNVDYFQCNKCRCGQTTMEVSELLLQSTISYKDKYVNVVSQLQILRKQFDNLKMEFQISRKNKEEYKEDDISFTGKGQSKISMDFGDLTNEFNQINEIANFTSHGPSQIVVDQEEITVREQRIQNLERQNFELKHELASKSHKLAHIFNAAFQYGGMKLLDYLQQAIGLVQGSSQDKE